MNDNFELYHHGVKGMKWGIRRKRKPTYQPKRWTSQDQVDSEIFGKRGAVRIRKRMDTKGLTRKQAETRETVGRVAAGFAIGTAVSVAMYAAANPQSVAKGASAVKSALTKIGENRYNASVLDSTGKVLKRFNMDYVVR